MLRIENKRYQKLDKSRVFAYKDKKINVDVDMKKTIDFLNTFGNTKYEL